jgi:hypothetical protein
MKELIGKKFRYKSKYGGLSDWTAEIVGVFPFFNVHKIDGNHKVTIKTTTLVQTATRNSYEIDEIEIID